MGHNFASLKLYCVALLVFCGSCRTTTEPKQPTGLDSVEPPKAVEVCNGLGIALSFSPHEYKVDEACTPIVVLTNLSKEDINIWVNRNKLVFAITDDYEYGKAVFPSHAGTFSVHDLGIWQDDIFTLKPDESKIFKIVKFGFGGPCIRCFMARYSNDRKEITTEEKKQFSLWTGTLISKPVTIEFVED